LSSHKSWEKEECLKDWIAPSSVHKDKAYCRICQREIRAHHSDLMEHAQSRVHLTNVSKSDEAPPNLKDFFDKPSVNHAELALAHYVAYTGIAIHAADGLSDLLRLIFPDSKIAKDLKLHRTKMTNLIVKIIAPHFRKNIVQLMKDNIFALLIDSSTDCSVTNITLIVAKILIEGNPEYYLYKAFEVTEATGKNLCNLLETSLLDNKIGFSNLIGICTDSAANLIGAYNSLISHFRSIKPNIFHFQCICHRIHSIFKDSSEALEPFFYLFIKHLVSHF